MRMAAQQRELRRNYIGLVSDKADEQRAFELSAKSHQLVKDYLRSLIAVVRNRTGDAR